MKFTYQLILSIILVDLHNTNHINISNILLVAEKQVWKKYSCPSKGKVIAQQKIVISKVLNFIWKNLYSDLLFGILTISELGPVVHNHWPDIPYKHTKEKSKHLQLNYF